MNPKTTDISAFEEGSIEFRSPIHLIVKSQDQIERRARLVASLQQGKIGRVEHREIATGLWVQCILQKDTILRSNSCRTFEFREPRGLASIGDGRYLLSDVNRVLLVDANANILKEYRHSFFAFLHSLSYDHVSRKFLVVSSGYDCLIEMDLEGNLCWEWYAWENGFSPTLEGVYLCRSPIEAERLQAEGKAVMHIDPKKYMEYGLMTSQRSNHPNSGCYHPSNNNLVLVTLGHSGEVLVINKKNGSWKSVVSGLKAMPHGIQPYLNGWIVTNTLMGEFWLLDANFNLTEKLITRNLSGKPQELGENEWLQATYPVGEGCFMALDANRGLLHIDLGMKKYKVYSSDGSWCIHHLVVEP